MIFMNDYAVFVLELFLILKFIFYSVCKITFKKKIIFKF